MYSTKDSLASYLQISLLKLMRITISDITLNVRSKASLSPPVNLTLAMDWIQPNISQLAKHSILSLPCSSSFPDLTSRSGTNLNTLNRLAPATTRFFSPALKKWQDSECSTPVAGWEDLTRLYMILVLILLLLVMILHHNL